MFFNTFYGRGMFPAARRSRHPGKIFSVAVDAPPNWLRHRPTTSSPTLTRRISASSAVHSITQSRTIAPVFIELPEYRPAFKLINAGVGFQLTGCVSKNFECVGRGCKPARHAYPTSASWLINSPAKRNFFPPTVAAIHPCTLRKHFTTAEPTGLTRSRREEGGKEGRRENMADPVRVEINVWA
jgi:hypothetical protein